MKLAVNVETMQEYILTAVGQKSHAGIQPKLWINSMFTVKPLI